jgi:hypothetical protein
MKFALIAGVAVNAKRDAAFETPGLFLPYQRRSYAAGPSPFFRCTDVRLA